MYRDELSHHGILGMKWGIRRSEAQLERARGRKNPEDPKKSKKDIKSMSDDDLRKLVDRLQMEKRYTQLSEETVKKGQDRVEKLLKAGSTLATATSTAITIYNNAEKIKEIINKKK